MVRVNFKKDAICVNNKQHFFSVALRSVTYCSTAHSTLILADSNSTAILSNGSAWQGSDRGRTRPAREHRKAATFEMSHDGYARRHGLIHRRLLILSPNGRELRGEDMLLPAPPDARRKGDTRVLRCPSTSAPRSSADLTADKLGALLRINGESAEAVPHLGGRTGGREKPVESTAKAARIRPSGSSSPAPRPARRRQYVGWIFNAHRLTAAGRATPSNNFTMPQFPSNLLRLRRYPPFYVSVA